MNPAGTKRTSEANGVSDQPIKENFSGRACDFPAQILSDNGTKSESVGLLSSPSYYATKNISSSGKEPKADVEAPSLLSLASTDLYPFAAESNRCYVCGGLGHWARECPSLPSSYLVEEPPICYCCGGRGHFARVCPSSPTSFSLKNLRRLDMILQHEEHKDFVVQSEGYQEESPEKRNKLWRKYIRGLRSHSMPPLPYTEDPFEISSYFQHFRPFDETFTNFGYDPYYDPIVASGIPPITQPYFPDFYVPYGFQIAPPMSLYTMPEENATSPTNQEFCPERSPEPNLPSTVRGQPSNNPTSL